MPNTPFYHLTGDINKINPRAVKAKGNYIYSENGQKVFDAASGAAVTSLGHNNPRVKKAVKRQMDTGVSYVSSAVWSNSTVENFSKMLIETTGGKLSKVYLTGSGSQANETALKLAKDYFFKQDKFSPRDKYISRYRSYHGNTIGALSLSGFESRRLPYESILSNNVYFVSPCYPYRNKSVNETNEQYVQRLSKELDNKFIELGPETVAAFIAEPVVGAALGCVPWVPGYLKAMQDICHKHGALFILDEVMCGMGRTGSLHAWEREEGLSPDIQTLGKGLGAGYQPIAAVMVSPDVAEVFKLSPLTHAQTFDSMPVNAAAALEVLTIIQEKNLVSKVHKNGMYLGRSLQAALGQHKYVGDIRGVGLFWGIEFVQDKLTKDPFDPDMGMANYIAKLAFTDFNITVYPGTGTVDGKSGDLIMLAPSFLITKKDVDHIVNVVSNVVNKAFESFGQK